MYIQYKIFAYNLLEIQNNTCNYLQIYIIKDKLHLNKFNNNKQRELKIKDRKVNIRVYLVLYIVYVHMQRRKKLLLIGRKL